MLTKILKKFWGYDNFRPLQEDIIKSVVSGQDTLGILPTGGGKSVTFQVPGLYLEGVVIVVTPLISLMKDQVDNLRKRRIQAVYLHSGMTYREKTLAKERLFNNKAKFLYISPERLDSRMFLNEIKTLKVSLIVVDEAHCISQWGYDFRPSYLKVKTLRKLFPATPVLALTASATKEVAEDICRQLEFRDPFSLFRASVLRENLSYIVRASEAKLTDIHKILNSVSGTGIVYVRSRKKTREIAEYLNNVGIPATFYHAGLAPEIKDERQTQWKEGDVNVMVATNAFGMGIDKADVRIVVHYDMPPSLEEYYQEAGRAGRDGLQSYAVLLTSKTDPGVLRRRVTMEFPPKETIKNIYTRLCIFSHLAIGEGYDRSIEFDIGTFCRTYNLMEAVVRPALRILSQAGYVDYIEEFENSSRLMITVDRDELYRIKLSSKEDEKIITAILRNYPGLFSDYVFINEKTIAFHSALAPETIYEKLVELSRSKIISYIPRRKTSILYFPTSMEEEKYIEIGKDVYENRMEILRKRIEFMIDYASCSGDCRMQKLMIYFGEEEAKPCGHCDKCRERKKSGRKQFSYKEISLILQEKLKSSVDGISEKELEWLFGSEKDKAVGLLRELHQDGIVRNEGGKWMLV